MKRTWRFEKDCKYASFLYKGESITIDTKEKYDYYGNQLRTDEKKEVYWLVNNDMNQYLKLIHALENYEYKNHIIDDSYWNK